LTPESRGNKNEESKTGIRLVPWQMYFKLCDFFAFYFLKVEFAQSLIKQAAKLRTSILKTEKGNSVL